MKLLSQISLDSNILLRSKYYVSGMHESSTLNPYLQLVKVRKLLLSKYLAMTSAHKLITNNL
ncbi:hypothetical protein BMS3Abin04_01578 [bacterium BMS3Abin04]|nr:hypothetical protein BMS3Abin04_01578 [bacterium BMS3Abin04]